MNKKKVSNLITVDGPVASGKTSLCCSVASKLGWQWVSTGVFYRGIAYISLLQKITQEKQIVDLINTESWFVSMDKQKTRFMYKKQDITQKIYTDAVDIFASVLASFCLVRETLLPYQKECFKSAKNGLVAEGRDCGTVVFPNAGLKIYLTAEDKIRAKRRASQRGFMSSDHFMHSQKQRDEKDINRTKSPLREPPESLVIDTGMYKFNEMVEYAYQRACTQFNIKPKSG